MDFNNLDDFIFDFSDAISMTSPTPNLREAAERICARCKMAKSLNDFYTHRTYGYSYYCKECDRARGKTPKAKKLMVERFHRLIQNPVEHGKLLSRYKLNRFVKLGRIIRPKLCPECGVEARIQAHHDDYSKPYDVRWFCPPCHKSIHRALRP